MKKYAYLGSSTGEKFCIKGIDVYKYRWLMEGDCVIVTDPKTKKPRSFSVYKIRVGDSDMRFIAGELSDGSTGFYEYGQ